MKTNELPHIVDKSMKSKEMPLFSCRKTLEFVMATACAQEPTGPGRCDVREQLLSGNLDSGGRKWVAVCERVCYSPMEWRC
jgi:hypothetical protein